MEIKRLKPLNDFAFQKAMGEKGDEEQLLAFLNAVLCRTGKGNLTSVRILEDRNLSTEVAGGKAGRFDVLVQFENYGWVNVEVQLKNEHNIEKRSLFYLDMVKFRRYRKAGKSFSLANPLDRWLAYFDDKSPPELIEELVKMDKAILMAQSKLEVIARTPELLRAYERYEKAASD